MDEEDGNISFRNPKKDLMFYLEWTPGRIC